MVLNQSLVCRNFAYSIRCMGRQVTSRFDNSSSDFDFDPRVAIHALIQSSEAIAFLNCERKVIFFNAAAEKLLGFTQDDVLGENVTKFLAPTFLHHRDHLILDFLKNENTLGNSISCDVEVVRNDGTRFLGNIKLSRFSIEEAMYFKVHMTDVSRRQKMEDDLLSKNAQLGKLNAQMEKFLYSTSHDLRSPLTSIMGLVNLTRMEAIDQTVLDYISKIESSTMKLDRIIRNMVSFSKASYQPKRSAKIDAEGLIHRVLNGHQNHSHVKLIHFDVVAQQDQLFHSDPERVEIILNNVLANAIHFFDANKVRSFVRVNITVQSNETLFEVIDNGIGIGKQHHDHIFSMFYKATLNSSGAGLGLYIVKECIDQLHGSITMESELGFGSVFRIRIPNDCQGQMNVRTLDHQLR